MMGGCAAAGRVCGGGWGRRARMGAAHLWRRENPLCAGGGVRGAGVCGSDSILLRLHNTHTQSELHACMAPSP